MKIDPKRMKHAAEKASALFGLLSNARRLTILCRLVEGEASVGELSTFSGVPQSSVSQQLALLRSHGLVATRREATTINYRLVSEATQRIMEAAYGAFCAPARKKK